VAKRGDVALFGAWAFHCFVGLCLMSGGKAEASARRGEKVLRRKRNWEESGGEYDDGQSAAAQPSSGVMETIGAC
jgi:hypothetical protein